MRFRVKTQDLILLITRVIVVEAASEEELLKQVKKDFPNSKVLEVDEDVKSLSE